MCVSHSVMSDPLQPHGPSPPGFCVHEILQTRILKWTAIPPPGDLPNSGVEPRSSALQMNSLPSEAQV